MTQPNAGDASHRDTPHETADGAPDGTHAVGRHTAGTTDADADADTEVDVAADVSAHAHAQPHAHGHAQPRAHARALATSLFDAFEPEPGQGRRSASHADDEEHDDGCYDIYETADGLRPVGSSVRRCILAKMRGRELTVPEMTGATHLTKSTISTHLALLHKEHLVGYREDPQDRRKKRYFLTARFVGMTCPTEPAAARAVPTMTKDALADPGGLPKAVLRAFVGELRASGLDLRPLLRDAGRRVGETIGSRQEVHGLEAWGDAVARFWQENELGVLELVEEDGPALVVRDCKLCCSSAGSAPMCGVAAGLLEGMASEALRMTVRLEPIGRQNAETAPPHGSSTQRWTGSAGDFGSHEPMGVSGGMPPSPLSGPDGDDGRPGATSGGGAAGASQCKGPNGCSCAFRLRLSAAEA